MFSSRIRLLLLRQWTFSFGSSFTIAFVVLKYIYHSPYKKEISFVIIVFFTFLVRWVILL